MIETLETDYLIIGAGATGIAFADEMIHASSDSHLIILDRLARPGGHWNHAYPFVTLHQPALYYGVNSEPLGRGGDDLVSKTEILTYYEYVIQKLVATGRVSYFPLCEYQGDGRFNSLEDPTQSYQVEVRRKTVDSTYTDVTVPSVTPPNYEVEEGVSHIPINDLVDLEDHWKRYVVLGAGKTGLDALLYLLNRDVNPEQITWVISNDAWYIDRATAMPNRLAVCMPDQLRCIGQAESLDDVFRLQEEAGHIMRLDENIWPTRYRCATITVAELEQLRLIKDVVRLGRALRIEERRLILVDGSVAVGPNTLFVNCTADGLTRKPPRPVYETDRITIQPVMFCQPAYSAAGIANVELRYDDDELKNYLCRPVPHPEKPQDYPGAAMATILNMETWGFRFPLWTLGRRLSAGHHMGFFHVIWFMLKSLVWRGRSQRKLRHFIAQLEDTP